MRVNPNVTVDPNGTRRTRASASKSSASDPTKPAPAAIRVRQRPGSERAHLVIKQPVA
jgi:hypothetical protein